MTVRDLPHGGEPGVGWDLLLREDAGRGGSDGDLRMRLGADPSRPPPRARLYAQGTDPLHRKIWAGHRVITTDTWVV